MEEDARERIQKLLVTGDNRLKQGVDPAKARESWEQALELAREAGLEERIRPLVEVRLADLEQRRPTEDRLDPLRLAADVVPGGRLARGLVRARQRRGLARARAASASTSSGSTRTPASGGTNSGGPPIRVATTERPQAIASSSAWPSGSTRLGWQRTWPRASRRGISSCGDAAEEPRRRRDFRAAGAAGRRRRT